MKSVLLSFLSSLRRRRQNAWKKAEAGLPEPEVAVADGFVATIQRTALATQAAGRRESQPESQPESLEGKVLSLLAADCPMSRFELSRRLGQKKISGQLNKVIRLPVFSPVSRSGAGAKLGFFWFSQ